MGSFRTLLAISVLITHSGPIFGVTLLNGDMAITLFFLVSGFLMSLILTEKYASVKLFYLNRLLRIYPPFWAAVLFTVLVGAIFRAPPFLDVVISLERFYNAGNWWALAYAAIANLFLVGADLGRALGSPDLASVVYYPSGRPDFPFAGLLLVPQSWTLPLELAFYFMAPWILRLRTSTITVLCVALVVLNNEVDRHLDHMGIQLTIDQLFPFQLQFFIFGVLAYRLYEQWRDNILLSRELCWFVSLVLVALVFFGYPAVKFAGVQTVTLYVFALLCMPFLFALSNGSRFDFLMGELSYPVYLFHLAIAQVLWKRLFEKWAIAESMWGPLTLVLTISVSLLYVIFVDRRIGVIRAAIARRAAVRPDTPAAVDFQRPFVPGE